MSLSRATSFILIFLAGLWGAGGGEAAGTSPQRVAFLGFELINTSLEPTTPDEARRIQMLDRALTENLPRAGRFELVAIPPDMRREIEASADISNCNGCERVFANRLGADLACWGTVQKVSNLILNINVYVEDARTGKMAFAKSVDIRGNTDESWRRGLDYVFRERLLGADPEAKD